MKSSNTIQIETDGLWARTHHLTEAQLAPLLTVVSTGFTPGGPLGHQRRRKRVRFYKADQEGRWWFPAWVLPQLVASLGHTAIIQDHTPSNTVPPTDESLRQHLPVDEQKLLDALVSRPRGIIEVACPAQTVSGIELICRYFPTLRLFIAASTQHQVQRLWGKLSRRLGSQVETMANWHWNEENRCHVGTLHCLANANPLDWDIIILTDAVEAVADSHLDIFSTLAQRRIFGFVQAEAPLGGLRRQRLYLLCGPIIHRCSPVQPKQALVRVLWSSPPWSPPVAAVSALERKRQGYWHNEARNDHIAAVAAAFTAAKRDALWQLGLLLDDAQERWLTHHKLPAVAILVESTEHGRELLGRLPGWRLLARLPESPEEEAGQANASNDPRVKLDQVIITLRWATSIPVLNADVLIRADGSAWPLNLPGLQSSDGECLRIDLADDFDAVAEEASRQRYKDYASRQWFNEGGPSWLRAPANDPHNQAEMDIHVHLRC